jgi:hypothetical protein
VSLLSLLATTDYGYSYSSTDTDPAVAAVFLATIMLIAIISSLITYAVVSFFLSRIFKKAGVPGWKAWVPVYSLWTTYELGGVAGWWAILMLVPVANLVAIVYLYIAMYTIGLKLGKSGSFVLWAIFLPLVWYIWLALDPSRWSPTVSTPPLVDTSAAPVVPPATTA